MGAAVGRDMAEPDEARPLLAAAAGAAPRTLCCCACQQWARAAPLGEAAIAAAGEQAPDGRATVGTTLVLVANTLARTAYFALTTSLVYFLTRTPLCWSGGEAVFASLLFTGVFCVACALGGLLADCVASRFGAAVIGYVLSAVAYVPLVVLGGATAGLEGIVLWENNASAVSCKQTPQDRPEWLPQEAFGDNASSTSWCGKDDPVCLTYLIASGLCLAIAQGILHTNLIAFGADQQVRLNNTENTRCYFSMLYWTRNAGAIVAVAGLSHLQMGVNGFFLNNIVSLVCLILSAGVFVSGFKYYVRQPVRRSAIVQYLRVLPDALRLRWLDENRGDPNRSIDSILDYAKVSNGGPHHDRVVEEVKTVGRMLIVFVLLISYSVGFTEMVNSFATQGLHMKAPVLLTSPTPPGILLIFDSLGVLITLPFLNNVAYPFLRRRGYRMTLHIRISVGMLVATVSFIVAGIIETARLHSLTSGGVLQQVGHTMYVAAPMTVLCQIPQYVLFGIGETFVRVTAMEYTYLSAPKAMRSIMMGLLLASYSIGPFVSIALHELYTNIFGWSTINDGHMDCVFYTLAVVQFLGSLAFYAAGLLLPLGLDILTIAN